MNDNTHTYQGYPVVPIMDPRTKSVIGWHVPYLAKSFLTEEDAHNAIDARIAEISEDLKNRLQ